MSNALKSYSPAEVREILGRAMKRDAAGGAGWRANHSSAGRSIMLPGP